MQLVTTTECSVAYTMYMYTLTTNITMVMTLITVVSDSSPRTLFFMSNYVIVKMITEQTPYLRMVKMMFI
jgi:hypothetical protein